MEKLVIYGVGMAFTQTSDVIWADMTERYEIAGIVDGNPELEDREAFIQGKKYKVIVSDDAFWAGHTDCYVYITTNKFFDEVKAHLLEKGVRDGHILDSDYVFDQYLAHRFRDENLQGNGVEIGGPSFVFRTVYRICASCDDVDFSFRTVWNTGNLTDDFVLEGGKRLGRRYQADATDMSTIEPGKYDFLLSCNNIEHIANPLKAVSEFIRVLKSGGTMILVVPNKAYNFDHYREDTLFGHIREDYENDVREDDLSHLEEILSKHDLGMDIKMSPEEFRSRSMDNYHNRCLHHHVFSIRLLEDIARYFELQVESLGEVFENYYMVARKAKS